MTAAAFKATYSDWKLVKTRGVIQIVFEVPLAEADLAYKVVGGMPNIAAESWFAIARLDPDQAAKPRPKVAVEKRLTQQAGICCADPVFRRFMAEEGKAYSPDESEVAIAVRSYCGVSSRSEIIPGSPAADKWDRLWGRFQAWKLAG